MRRVSMSDLDGKNALVTGGSGDIGAAMAAELTRRGARVTLLDLKSPEAAQEWITTASAFGEVGYVQADVRDRPALDAALEGLGRLDIAIANAGIVESAPFLEITAEQWQRHLDINLTGTFHTAQ